MDDTIDMLVYAEDEELSSRFNFPTFIASMLSGAYRRLNSVHHRTMLVNRIEKGYYSSKEEIEEMARTYLSKSILFNPDHGFEVLTTKCGLSEEEANEFIAKYCKYNDNLNDLLSAELDVSNTNIEMKDMISELVGAFLESEASKGLEH